MYHTILFDLDGTITNSKEGITKSVQYTLAHFGISEPDLDKLECFIGPPLEESFTKYYGLLPKDLPKAMDFYRERYKPIGCYENELYEGISDLLFCLKQAKKTVALATSKPEVFALEILKQHSIVSFFDVVVGCELNGDRSKKVDVINEVFHRLSYSSSMRNGTIMVGDREHDILGAKSAKIDSVGIRYGFSNIGELEAAGANYVLDTVADLKTFLLSH
ncbi:MAG: HAD hydrolase-like protein [Acetivibrio sp.]